MMKQIYTSAWILLTIAALVSILSGSFDPVGLLVFSLVALALVLSLALWSVYVQTRDLKTE
jgi:Mn2+/Fe2+ NRAMP family transporter